MSVLKYKEKWHIPVPSGPRVVGSLDIMTPGNEKEGIFARLYYPAEGKDHYERYKDWPLWMPDYECIRGLATVTALKVPITLLEYVIHWMWGSVHIPAVPDAQPIRKPHPFVLFSHGLGANRTMYSSIAIDLASHGFFVVNLEHREKSACATFVPTPDGQLEWLKHEALPHGTEVDYEVRVSQLEARSDELSRTLDLMERLNQGLPVTNVLNEAFDLQSFKGTIDLAKPIIMGHSFGGATTLLGLAREPRLKIGALLDPWLFGLRETIDKLPQQIDEKPMVIINMEAFLTDHSLHHLKSFLSSPSGAEKIMCTIRGTVHYNQTDVPFATPWYCKYLAKSTSKLGEHLARDINMAILRIFLRRQLGLEVSSDCHDVLAVNDENIEKISWFLDSKL